MAVLSPISTHKLRPAQTSPFDLWHLLSLDAPTVAALWTWFIASANHLHLPKVSILAMFLAVWMLYVADRLLDARALSEHPLDVGSLEARHHFHHRHRSSFLIGLLLASTALASLLPHLPSEAIHLYLILGGLVFAYFILIHATESAHRLPKEFAVGICFAAATFIPTVAHQPDLRLRLFPLALLFASLCTLNCLFIFAWEHDSKQTNAHPITHTAIHHLPQLTAVIAAVGLGLCLLDHHAQWEIAAASTLSLFLLQLLHHYRRRIPAITLRAAADLALITPVLLLPLLSR
ncbi:hypothetical protein [Tunturiibacter lichenicola]|uniref:hypothetical protein n=1 Tax=Tunturiibacter lichenicola TaxID=2051959 RepID=UPI003D9BBEF4